MDSEGLWDLDMSHSPDSAPIRVTSHSFVVTYGDTDQMGVVYHSNYLVWFEIGRTDTLRSLGHQYRQWEEEQGIYLPVLSATLQYKRPARYDDWICVETSLVRLTAAGVDFHYRVLKTTGQHGWQTGTSDQTDTLATGTTRHAFVDRTGKVRRVAKELLPEIYELYQAR